MQTVLSCYKLPVKTPFVRFMWSADRSFYFWFTVFIKTRNVFYNSITLIRVYTLMYTKYDEAVIRD